MPMDMAIMMRNFNLRLKILVAIFKMFIRLVPGR